MVYCGKPSRGCQMCRTRRIKCDETKPTCNQCAKARRGCPGYRDEFELIFRNETKATERRAQRGSRKDCAASTTTTTNTTYTSSSSGQTANGGFPSSLTSSSSSSTDPLSSFMNAFARAPPTGEGSILPALNMPTEQVASCHFLSNFILIPQQGGTKGFMAYLQPLMRSEGQNSHLQHAFRACSLAHLGNRVRSTGGDILDRALSEYTKALAATHTALTNPEQCRTDASLAAVLLLGLYENITAKERGMFSWGSHIEGAISLVKSRGRRQLRTKVGRLLFVAVRTLMIVHTLTTANAPVGGVDWWVSSDADADTDADADAHAHAHGSSSSENGSGGGESRRKAMDPAAECQRIDLRTSELRADATRLMMEAARTPESIGLMLVLIRRAQAVDQEAVRWMRDLPDAWKFESVAWEDSVPGGDFGRAEVFPGRVDLYRDYGIASQCNMLRGSRLILASVIVRCAAWVCSPVDYRTTPEYATAARTCVDMITDIIASVPYHLGWHLKPERRHLLQRRMSGFACGEEDSLKGLTGYYLTWPLAIVAGQDYTTDSQRAWVHGRLTYIADELGVKYARIIRQLNVRIPSMLIRRDGLMAEPYPMAHNFVKLMSAKYLPPPAGDSMSPLQQRDATPKKPLEANKKELLPKLKAEPVVGRKV